MDIAFIGLMHNSVVVYLDNITIYFKNIYDHLFALKKVFQSGREYSISLSLKKSIFAVTEGKILGFIVSEHGMVINPRRTESISNVGLPSSKKSMQSFLGNINFVGRFVPNISQIVRHLQDMIKKYIQFKWFEIQKNTFAKIRKAIAEFPALMSPDFTKDFILYTFSTKLSYVVVLTKKKMRISKSPSIL